jgi:LuxR family transcriptional regulator, activator of tox operons
MEVRAVLPHQRGVVATHFAGLIEAVGTASFEPTLINFTRQAIGCDHVTAFAHSARTAPRVLLAANAGAQPLARLMAKKYLSNYWQMDPANCIDLRQMRLSSTLAVRLSSDEIPHDDYHFDCYASADLVDRFSILRAQNDEIVRLNFYRRSAIGKFRPTDTRAFDATAELILALILKHNDILNQDNTAQRQPDAVGSAKLQLPRREAEVCTYISKGLSSRAIAEQLGISVNTVLTYRKRIYTRLGINSQNELLRLML